MIIEILILAGYNIMLVGLICLTVLALKMIYESIREREPFWICFSIICSGFLTLVVGSLMLYEFG